jgi:MFS superfamily sulfate permease-like transporter
MTWAEAVLQRLTIPSTPIARQEAAAEPALVDAWRTDVPAAVVVFLIAVPLCLGIALASGAPLFAGIISGVVGALVVGVLSGSQLMVSGPAAGLAAVVMSSAGTLGSYRALLAATVVAGGFQLLFALFRAGIIGYYFPFSVIRGMLAAIGLILILKQIPHAVGYDVDFEGDEVFLQANAENTFTAIGHALNRFEPAALLISAAAILILLLWDYTRLRRLRWLPAPLIVVLVGTAGQLLLPLLHSSLQLGPEHLVGLPIPSTLYEFGQLFAWPDWSALSRVSTWRIALGLAIVASLESLLSVEATDRIDPYKREAPLDRELAAQGVGNIVSGMIGGLPISGVIVRSAANVDAGAQTKLSAILQGLLLAALVTTIPGVLNRIPLASLAVLLIYTGFKLLHPTLVRHLWRQGRTQFLPFIVTIIAILFTDLFAGIAVGLMVGFAFVVYDQLRFPCYTIVSPPGTVLMRVRLHDQVTFLNKASLAVMLNRLSTGSRIEIDGTSCRHIDHDVLEFISDFRQTARLKQIDFRTVGIALPAVSPSH